MESPIDSETRLSTAIFIGVPEAKGLEGLPAELLYSILNCIVRPSDLKALCLVSKSLSNSAFRHLYRGISIPYKYRSNEARRLDILSQSRHLHHIRSIDLPSGTKWPDTTFRTSLRPLLEQAPLHTLERFTYGNFPRPSAEDLYLVWRHHKKSLRNLQLDFFSPAPSLWEAAWCEDLKSLRELEDLEIDFAMNREEELYPVLFKRLHLKKLQKFTLRFRGKRTDRWKSPAICLGFLPFALTSIMLTEVRLPHSRDWRLADYPALSSLELRECYEYAPLLDDWKTPKLKRFSLRDEFPLDESTIRSIDNFLLRFDSLCFLNIDWTSGGLEGDLVPAVRTHASNLKCLGINPAYEEPGRLDLWSNLELCKPLTYLALPMRVDGELAERCIVGLLITGGLFLLTS